MLAWYKWQLFVGRPWFTDHTTGGVAKVVEWLVSAVARGDGATVVSTDPTAPGIVKRYQRYCSSLIMEYANRLGGRFQERFPGRFFQNVQDVIRNMTIAELQSYSAHRGGKKTAASEGYVADKNDTKKSKRMKKLANLSHKEKTKYGKSKLGTKNAKRQNKARREKSKRTYKDYYLICIRDGCDGKGKRHQRKPIPTTGQANKSYCKFASCNGDGAPTSLSNSKTVSKYWSYVLDEHGRRVEAPSDEETDTSDEETEETDDENEENDE